MKHLLSFLFIITTLYSYSQNNTKPLFVPYSLVNEVPFFNSCGNLLTNKEKETCMKERIIKEITSNINVNLIKESGLMGQQKSLLYFKVNELGEINNVRVKSNSDLVENEFVRLVSNLPKMNPAIHNNSFVTVSYSFPFVLDFSSFQNKPKSDSFPEFNSSYIGFKSADERPICHVCYFKKTKKEQTSSTRRFITNYFFRNVNIKEIIEDLNIKQEVTLKVGFVINSQGQAENVKVLSYYNRINEEAEKALSNLPLFIPAVKEGKDVPVFYTQGINIKPNSEEFLSYVENIYQKQKKYNGQFSKQNGEVVIEDGKFIGERFSVKRTDGTSFSNIGRVPICKGCERKKTNKELLTCFAKFIREFIDKEFDNSLVLNNGFDGYIKIITLFEIDKSGEANYYKSKITGSNIKGRSLIPSVEKEVKRLFSSLPKFSPGILEGEPITSSYTWPICISSRNGSTYIDVGLNDPLDLDKDYGPNGRRSKDYFKKGTHTNPYEYDDFYLY